METIDITTVKGVIYKVTNLKNNKVYVGQTLTHMYRNNLWYPTGATYRWACHISNARIQSSPIYIDLCVMGPDVFKMEVVDICEVMYVNERERDFIKLYDSMIPNGYNCNFGTSDVNTTKQKVLTELGELVPSSPKPPNLSTPKYTGQVTIKKGLDKITYLKTKNIQEVDIRPIRRNGEFNIIRVLVATTDSNKRYRFQFGKKPLKTVAMVEVLDMIRELEIPSEKQKLDPELQDFLEDKDDVVHFPHLYKMYKDSNITRITISPHKQNDSEYIRIIVHRKGDNKQKDMKRHVLGTKTECPSATYKRVMGLVTRLVEGKNIYIINNCSQLYDNGPTMSATGGCSGDSEVNSDTA